MFVCQSFCPSFRETKISARRAALLHLEITPHVPGPFRPEREHLPRLGARDEIPANRRDSFAELRRLINPALDMSLYERADSPEFS